LAVLFDEANGTLNMGLHCVIICCNQIAHNIVFDTIVDDLFRLEFLSIVCSQEAELSASEGVEFLSSAS